MTAVFFALLAVGTLLGLVAALLIWRARAKGPSQAADTEGRLGRWIGSLVAALDYASTRRAWRYRLPWVLVLGEPGSGKTSLVLSASDLLQPQPDERYASLGIADASWSVMTGGALVDVAGQAWASAGPAGPRRTAGEEQASGATGGSASATSAGATAAVPPDSQKSRWGTLLGKLVDLRPERPVDAVILTVSARMLLGADLAELERSAAGAYRRLCDLQDTFGFVLPVSVVVTQCDRVDGFPAFWRAQPAGLLGQIFGWSASGLARNDTPAEWCEAAFATVGDELRALQIDAAARDEDPSSAEARDGMLLFPTFLQALEAPLGQWLSTAFRATLDRPGHLFRGIFFTGDIEGSGVAPRRDVSFVTGLLKDKVFAERGNARVVRASAWSRNRYLRGFQIAALTVAAVLAVGLGASAVTLHDKVARLDRALVQLRGEPAYAGGVCPSAGKISSLLLAVRELDTASFHWANPWSWFGQPLRRGAAQVVAGHVFADVILPGLACRLSVRAQNLLANGQAPLAAHQAASANLREARSTLTVQLRALTELEAGLATYEEVAKPFSGAATEDDLRRFARLLNFAYGLPASLVRPEETGSILAASLSWASTDARPTLPDDAARNYARQLGQMETRLRDALVLEAGAGQQLLLELGRGRGDAAAQTNELVWWLTWTRDNWLGRMSANAPRNLCAQLRADLAQQVRQLVLTDASSGHGAAGTAAAASPYNALLDETATIFSPQRCDVPVYARLDAIAVPPYDPLIVHTQGERAFNPAFTNEFAGLMALAKLPFMQVGHLREPFVCDAAALGWDADALGDATAYIAQYRGFRQRFGLAQGAAGPQPLYAQIASRQLESALNHALNRAQRPKPKGSNVWPAQSGTNALAPAPFDEQALAQTSRDLAGGLGTLVSIERAYQAFGFAGSFAALSGCLQQFADNRLSTVGSLAVQSQLYRPAASDTGPEFFDLGTIDATRDYLARQVARAQVLASYAAPFVTLAQNSGTARGNDPRMQTTAYWSNSIAEVNRYVPSNDPASEMGQLATLFVDRLNGMTAQNCGARLQNLAGASGANNLFASVRRNLIGYTELRCQGSDADAFSQLFALFDATLAGRYPFGESGAPEASLAAVRDFFAQYDLQSATLRAKLPMLPRPQQAPVRTFLDRLDEARRFLAATLRADGSLAVRVQPTFNVRPASERGADQIVRWQLSTAAQSAAYPNSVAALDWLAGQPLTLELTWADLSRFAPYVDPGVPDAPAVEGRRATFSAQGNWALMRVVQGHAADRGASPADGITLRFTVPIVVAEGAPVDASAGAAARRGPRPAATSFAQLMLNLRLEGTDPTSHAAVALKLPVFPARSPTLQPAASALRTSAGGPPIPSVPPLPPLQTLPPAVDVQTSSAASAD